MSLLDSMLGAVTGQGEGGQTGGGNAALLNLVLSMLAGGTQGSQGGAGGGLGGLAAAIGGGSPGMGGLGGLVQQFQRSGLGDIIASWVSTGQNMPISPDQLGGALGDDTVSSMASQAGMGRDDLLGQLSQMLPQVVDRMTPDGRLPQAGQMPDLGQLAGLLGGMLNQR